VAGAAQAAKGIAAPVPASPYFGKEPDTSSRDDTILITAYYLENIGLQEAATRASLLATKYLVDVLDAPASDFWD
jgi:hypothetical protein